MTGNITKEMFNAALKAAIKARNASSIDLNNGERLSSIDFTSSRVKAALEAAEKVRPQTISAELTKWLPIADAPKDGTRILGLTAYGVEMVRFKKETCTSVVGYKDGWWGLEQDSGCLAERHLAGGGIRPSSVQPTHYQPLPSTEGL